MIVRPQRLDVSILEKIKEGTLTDNTQNVDIFGSLANYKSCIIDNPATADLRELSSAEWSELEGQGRFSLVNSPTAFEEYNHKIAQLSTFDDHVDTVGQILHQQQLAHPCYVLPEIDLWTDKKWLGQARDDYAKFGEKQKRKLKKQILELKERKAKAKANNKEAEVADAVKEMHSHQDQALYFWCRKFDEEAREILESEVWEQIDDMEDSYEVFQALNINEQKEKRDIFELIDALDHSRAELESNIENTLAILDANLNHIQGLFELSHRHSRVAFTRMFHLCADDVRWKGEDVQREVMLERFMSGGFSYFEACKDIDSVRKDLETARLVFEDKIEGGFEELGRWRGDHLDVCVDAERAWVKAVANTYKSSS